MHVEKTAAEKFAHPTSPATLSYDTSFFFRPHNGAQADPSTVTGTHHYFYTFPNGTMNVYDMDNNFALVQSVSIPTTNVRGVVFDPQSGMLYFSDGGNGGSNGTGVLIKYNLVTQAVVYKQSYPFGVDSMAITPDGKTIYMPDGSASTDGTWHIISTATGQVTGSILTAAGVAPHDTDMSANGQYVYMEGVTSNVLYVASIATNQIVQKVQPFTHLIRPFVVNQSGTLAYVTENGIIGFGVGNLQTGNVLYNVSAPGFSLPPGFDTTYTTPSHGISLSPDGKTVYVVDMPNSYVHVFNVNGLPNTAPTMTASIPITPISGTESPCKIDCSKEGWLEQSLDGRYLFVGNSGSIIDTTTDQVVANLNTLSDTRMFLEVDWVNGVPVNSEDRTDFYWNSGPTTPTPTSTPTLPPVSGPVSKVWYFAEGRVGAGFSEFLTLGNPTGTACQVNLTYLTQPDSGTGGTKTFSFSVPASTRVTRWVDSDLGTSTSGHGISDAATITVDTATTPNCSGIVAERPMYFNALGTNSGSDVLGVTHTSTTFSFADMAVGTQAGGGSVSSFLPILNPGTATAPDGHLLCCWRTGRHADAGCGRQQSRHHLPLAGFTCLTVPCLGGAHLQPTRGERASHLLQQHQRRQCRHRLGWRRCDWSATVGQRLALCRRLHRGSFPGELRAGQSRSCQDSGDGDHHAGV